MAASTIHTLGARDNVMLEVIRDYFGLGSGHMHEMIKAMLAQVEQILLSKGVKYSELKHALVPKPHRREIMMVFDSTRIGNMWYGYPIHSELIPLFLERSNHSVLVGDYLGSNSIQGILYQLLSSSIMLASDLEFSHSSQFFLVYINNLTDKMVEGFHSGLAQFDPYVGYVDLTFSSRLKTYVSTILVNGYLKHRQCIIMGHEDDRGDDEDINMLGYPFEASGFVCKSLPGYFFDQFLSYKIERPVFPGFESETEFSLCAVSPMPLPLTEFEITIEPAKLQYLLDKKHGTIKRTGFAESERSELEFAILNKIASNYIYNLSHNPEYGTTKFNIVLEFQPQDATTDSSPVKTLVSLEYIPVDKTLRLITMY